MSNISLEEWLVMGSLTLLSILFGALPYLLLHKLKGWQKLINTITYHLTMTVVTCAGGGVLIATTFAHMLPVNRENFASTEFVRTKLDSHFPITEVVTLLGFFFIYFLEEVAGLAIGLTSDPPVPSEKSENNNVPAQTEITVDSESVNSIESKLKFGNFLALVALSFHAVMEGIAIGIQDSDNLWLMFSAIASHKFIISFCMGMELCAAKSKLAVYAGSIFLFAILSPTGILIGSVLTDGTSITSLPLCILEGLATGTLLYVVFFEILSRERDRRQTALNSTRMTGFLQFVGVLVGAIVMLCLLTFISHGHSHDSTSAHDGHDHDHDHDHDHEH